MAYNALTLRPHVLPASQVMGLIAPSTCWHFDAWLMQRLAFLDEMYFVIETRAGGRDLLTRHCYWLRDGRLIYTPEPAGEAQPVTLQDKALWPRFAELNAMHWRFVYPMALAVPPGYRSRSVAFHYVRAPNIEPFDGTEVNMHQYEQK
jgi:hypothetical protein